MARLLFLQLLKVSESVLAVCWCNGKVLGAASVTVFEVEAMNFAFSASPKQHVACMATTAHLGTQCKPLCVLMPQIILGSAANQLSPKSKQMEVNHFPVQ